MIAWCAALAREPKIKPHARYISIVKSWSCIYLFIQEDKELTCQLIAVEKL